MLNPIFKVLDLTKYRDNDIRCQPTTVARRFLDQSHRKYLKSCSDSGPTLWSSSSSLAGKSRPLSLASRPASLNLLFASCRGSMSSLLLRTASVQALAFSLAALSLSSASPRAACRYNQVQDSCQNREAQQTEKNPLLP